jgi:hypothetical protein
MTVAWHGDELARLIARKAEEAARAGAERLLEGADQLVPDDPGTVGGRDLRNSGKVTSAGHTAAVSYDTDYAIVQHEAMNWEHRPGQSAKFLERPLNRDRGEIAQVVARKMKL